MIPVTIHINGEPHDILVEPGERLTDTLRDRFGLTGTKEGCGEGQCGACTVNLNGKAVLSCLMLTVQADRGRVLTIEGLRTGLDLHPLQTAFLDEAAVQCGYCTPGMIMAGHALIKDHPDPDETRVKACLANNLCRCTGYEKPARAILKAAEKMQEDRHD
nr:(2Fe-2S)-binding protein [Desulfobacula sp.]